MKEENGSVSDVPEDKVDIEYDVMSLSRGGGAPSFARRFRSRGVARNGRRLGEEPAVARKSSTGSSDRQQQQHQQRYGGAGDGSKWDSKDNSVTHGPVRLCAAN